MKRIVVCFDGTWNKPADESLPPNQQVETNVRRFYESVLPQGADGIAQVTWYDKGVGTHWYDQYIGGAMGTGLDLNIMQGYKFLSETYEEGDEVFVLGFSRGAYTARSLVGLIRNCGLLQQNALLTTVGIAYGIYRTHDDGPDSRTARLFRRLHSREIPIKFVGVWDTVGALGVPLHLLHEFNLEFYKFHDTSLSRIVKNAYQAVALDEHREDYDICLWNPESKPEQTIEQRWFAGAHCDVGGGYDDRQLSDLPLTWMMQKAAALGLGLTSVALGEKNYLGDLRDSYAEFMQGKYALLRPRHLRAVQRTQFGFEIVDDSVRNRMQDLPAYHPTNPGLL
ncbi:MAG: DUF2235 domain-containing protein [Blastocatellia bacterium]